MQKTFYQWTDVACISSKCFWKELWSIYQHDLIYLVSLLQNYSPQYEAYDVKSGVTGGITGYPGPPVCTSVCQYLENNLAFHSVKSWMVVLLVIQCYDRIVQNSLFFVKAGKKMVGLSWSFFPNSFFSSLPLISCLFCRSFLLYKTTYSRGTPAFILRSHTHIFPNFNQILLFFTSTFPFPHLRKPSFNVCSLSKCYFLDDNPLDGNPISQFISPQILKYIYFQNLSSIEVHLL